MRLTKATILVLILVAFIAISLIMPKKYFWGPVKGIFSAAVAPVQKATFKGTSSISDFLSTIMRISQLSRENEELKKERDRLLAEKTELAEVAKENEILRDQLGFQQKAAFKLIPAEVIAKEPTNIQESIIINLGKNKGISEGMPVISSNMLVGKISEAGFNSSHVILITNPNSIINAMLQDSRASGLVKGELGYGLVMESIPQDVKINVSDLVVTSGLGGNFPKGLLLGEVSEIISKQSEIFQSATLRPVLDFSKLELVFVILGIEE